MTLYVAGGGGGGASADGVRLARALEDAERLRGSLAAERALAGEVAGAHRRELDALQQALRRAEKQRGGAWRPRAQALSCASCAAPYVFSRPFLLPPLTPFRPFTPQSSSRPFASRPS